MRWNSLGSDEQRKIVFLQSKQVWPKATHEIEMNILLMKWVQYRMMSVDGLGGEAKEKPIYTVFYPAQIEEHLGKSMDWRFKNVINHLQKNHGDLKIGNWKGLLVEFLRIQFLGISLRAWDALWIPLLRCQNHLKNKPLVAIISNDRYHNRREISTYVDSADPEKKTIHDHLNELLPYRDFQKIMEVAP